MHDNTRTRALAEYIAGAGFDALPSPVVDHTKLLVLDSLGVGIFGAGLPWCKRLQATAHAMEAPGRIPVWCTPLRFSAPTAAMINATAVHGFELDDVGPGGHNGSVTLSSALAAGQHRDGISGKELIASIVTGIETAARVNNSVGRIPHEGIGFHNPGLMGTFASVASAAVALRLDAGEVVHALGHAGQQAASLMFTHHGGMGKRLLAGQAARAGTFGALLAANGFTNADNVFEAEYGGFCAAHTGNRQPPAEIRQVRIRLGKGYHQNVAWPYTPTTITSAQLNLFFVTAIMLLENDVFVDQFTEEKIRDPKVLELIERISITRDPALDGTGSAEGNPLEVELKDGTVLSAWGRARGAKDRPIPREDVLEKFRKVTAKRLARAAQDQIIALCDRLETLPNATTLLDPLPK